MQDVFDFLGAVFSVCDGDPVFNDGERHATRDRDWITSHAADLFVEPVTDKSELTFVWGFLDDVSDEALDELRLDPTALLRKKDRAIAVWAFEDAVPFDDVARALGEHLDEAQFEGIPLPGALGWKLQFVDPDIFHPFERITKMYGPSSRRDAMPAAASDEPVVYGRFAEGDKRLKRKLKVSTGSGKDCKVWKTKDIAVGELIAVMSKHRVGKKDGAAIVLGELAGGRRVKSAVKAAYGIGLDIDVGMSGAELDELLTKFGRLAVRHTTHSHLKALTSIRETDLTRWLKKSDEHDDINDASARAYLQHKAKLLPEIVEGAHIVATEHRESGVMIDVEHAPVEKHRIIFPFAHPYVVADQGGQEEALKMWKRMPARLADRIGAIPIDEAATDPSRLFYLPRHEKNRPHESAIFAGPLLDWEELLKLDPMEEIAERLITDQKHTGKTQTDEGRALIGWYKRRGEGFQLAEVVDAYADDRIRSRDGTKVIAECPFDEYHSNAGDPDDVAFFCVNAGDGPVDSFVAHCQHDSCKDYSVLDFVARMVEQEWFTAEALEDDDFDILAEADEPPFDVDDAAAGSPPPKKDKKKAKDPDKKQDRANAIWSELEDELAKNSDNWDNAKLTDLVEEYLKKASGFNVSEDLRDLFSRNKAGPKIVRMLNAIRAKNREDAGAEDEIGRLVYEFSGQADFDTALSIAVKALKRQNHDEPRICAVTDRPVKLVRLEDGTTQYEEMNSEGIWAMINESTSFRIPNGEDGTIRVPVDVSVSKQVYQTCYKLLPQAPEIIYTPVFTSEGELISEPGWYREHGIYLADTGFDVDEVPEEPEWEDVEEAVDWIINDLLVDFPFLDFTADGGEDTQSSLANAISMLLTPFMRRMIEGTTPLFLVNKPVPGTGGTFLGSLPIKLCEGADATPLHYSQNDEEMQKALLASIMEAKSHLFFDNINTFTSRVILAALTSRTIGGRLLGQSKTITRPNTFGWVATGNNPVLSEEMERRTVRISLNALTTDIQTRTFKHAPSFPLDNRAKAVRSILLMIQWWIATGSKRFKERKRASYEDWSEQVGGVLQACGIEGFLANKRVVVGDMTEAALFEFVREWLKRFGAEEEVTAQELFQHALDMELDYLQGANEDQKRGRFQAKLPSLSGRLFEIKNKEAGTTDVVMIRQTMNDDNAVVYILEHPNDIEDAA